MQAAKGSVLIVSLILLLAMTLLATASIRGAALQERMGGNLYDRALAFQAAEAGLRAAEARLDALAAAGTAPIFDGTNGFYPTPTPTAGQPDRWEDSAVIWVSAPAATTGPRAFVPQYIVEDLGVWPDPPGCDQTKEISPTCLSPRYRITARNQVITPSSAVAVLQSTYRP